MSIVLALAILPTNLSLERAIDQSVAVARKYPFYSAWVQMSMSGTDVMSNACYHIARRSKSWGEIDVSASGMIDQADPKQSLKIYELRDGRLTIYLPEKKLFSESNVASGGDALEQLVKVFDQRENNDLEIAVSPDALKRFLSAYRHEKHWTRNVVEASTRYDLGETSLDFDRRTGRFTFCGTGHRPVSDTNGIELVYSSPGAAPVLTIPADAKHVKDVGRVSR